MTSKPSKTIQKPQNTKTQPQKTKQLALLPKEKAAYGGILRNTRKGRSGARKISTQHTMHLVLRSSKAKGHWSFQKTENKKAIQQIVNKHATRNFIKVLSLANVGNHLHLHIKLHHRAGYKAFVRAITGAIALFIMQASKNKQVVKSHAGRFWDYRPFSTIINSYKHLLNMRDYMTVNALEGLGFRRDNARMWIARQKDLLEHRTRRLKMI